MRMNGSWHIYPRGEVLLSRRVVAGLGYVFKSEVLFLARIPPFTTAAALPDAQPADVLAIARNRHEGKRPLSGRGRPSPVSIRAAGSGERTRRQTVPALRGADSGEDRRPRANHVLVSALPAGVIVTMAL